MIQLAEMTLIPSSCKQVGDTPLNWAAMWSRVEVAALLIEKGADVNKAAMVNDE